MGAARAYDAAEALPPTFTQKSFFEYHLYTMALPTTIRDNETKQVSLLSAAEVPVTKKYLYDGRKQWWFNVGSGYRPGESYDASSYHKVNITLEVKNSEVNHLGMPLPAGTIRVYKNDTGSGLQFVGEDTIDHTAKDEL